MARVSVVIAAALMVSAACGADTSSHEFTRDATPQAAPTREAPPVIRVPDISVDRTIRRDLNAAIAQHAELNQREISFHVVNGDVSVTGTVRSEDERKKVNELAMNIAGVKSVANALRIAE
jgi:osmotically-inducible protein OsmY